jgi:hypothetical protein
VYILLLLWKTAKLAFMDFYAVLITDSANFDYSYLEPPRQLKSLRTRQLLPAIDFFGLL